MLRLIWVIPAVKKKWIPEDFQIYIEQLTKEQIKEHFGKDDLELTTFDLYNGYIQTQVFPKTGKPNKPIREIKHNGFKSSTKLDENNNKALSLNKTHVYDFIIKLGKQHAGELIGISIAGMYESTLSKNGKEGSIEMYDFSIYLDSKYDHLFELYNDDFSVLNMGLENLSYFKKAFHKDARNFVLFSFPKAWPFHNLISGIMSMRPYPSEESEINLEKQQLAKYEFSIITKFLRNNFGVTDFSRVKFSLIKMYLCGRLKSKYGFAFALASGKITYTFLSGISSPYYIFDDDTRNDVFERFSGNEMACKFYKKYMDVGEPIEGTFLQPLLPVYQCKNLIEKLIDFSVVQLPEVKAKIKDHYIFLIGIDYINNENKISFSRVYYTRLKEMIKTIEVGSSMVHVFDFLEGVKRTLILIKNEDGSVKMDVGIKPDELDTYDPIIFNKDYKLMKNEWGEEEYFFTDISSSHRFQFHKRLSITQFYTLLLQRISLTSNQLGKVKQVWFISHGDEKGPIIYNQLSLKKNREDYSDKIQPRNNLPEEWLDPHTSDMGLPLFNHFEDIKNILALRNVLTHDAKIICLGLNSNEVFLKLIDSIVSSDEYKKGNLLAESIITLKNPGIELRRFLRTQTLFNKKEDSSTVLKWRFKIGELLLFFKNILRSSYMASFSYTADRSVYGGLPGFSTYVLRDGTNILMGEYPEKYYRFYKRHFGLEKVLFNEGTSENEELKHMNGYVRFDHKLLWIREDGIIGVEF